MATVAKHKIGGICGLQGVIRGPNPNIATEKIATASSQFVAYFQWQIIKLLSVNLKGLAWPDLS